MRCPRCGAENAESAQRCYLCEHPFTDYPADLGAGSGGEPAWGAPPTSVPPAAAPTYGEPPGASAPSQGEPPGAGPGYPPPPGAAAGYQPPPPGAYPPDIKPVPPAKAPSRTRLAVIATVVVLAIAGAVAAFLLTGNKVPKIKVGTPPGWEIADEEMKAQFKEEAQTESGDMELDYLFVRDGGESVIAVAHGNAYIADVPDSEDLATVENFFMQEKDAIYEQFEGVASFPGVNISLDEYEVRELACGLPALFMRISLNSQSDSLVQDYIFMFKNKTGFFAIVSSMGTAGNAEEIDFLTSNISFE